MISQILISFYKLLITENPSNELLSFSKSGHIFEDKVADILKGFADVKDIKVRKPINYPTISGMKDHQFDCSFKVENILYAIECKKQNRIASKNQIYYFNSIMTDHILGIKIDKINEELRGIFLSTTDLDGKSMIYAITNGIRFVTPNYPPLEYMLLVVNKNTSIEKSIKYTIPTFSNKHPLFDKELTRKDPSPALLYEQYCALLEEWKHNISNTSHYC